MDVKVSRAWAWNATNYTKKRSEQKISFYLLMDFMRNIRSNGKHCMINKTLSISVRELGLAGTLIKIIKFCPKIMKSFLIFRDWILFWFKPWLLGDYLSKLNASPTFPKTLIRLGWNFMTSFICFCS